MSVVQFVMGEPRAVLALVRWIRGWRPPGEPITHHRGVAGVLWVAVGLTVLEGAVFEIVLAAVLGDSVWVLVALALHVYGVFFLLALQACGVTRPHTVEPDRIVLRSGFSTDVLIDRADVLDVHVGRYREYDGARGWRPSADGTTATIAAGEANVEIRLGPGARVVVGGRSMADPPVAVYITADEPRRFVRALRGPSDRTSNLR
ncbi:hypothetical protein P0W64_01290 [Tsukamurella sp. 8F]|uniref:hypothetical protein n=1 Tax=unclassified Tsukamurella TaxID=2633480 RepID=UPI0023B9C7FA|nr:MULTISPECIES: hypothetical protein [unclassified Tsukamurella]MDF0529219.1 hypothetical protein [Tsukamurella sp. 8J]MDF0585404.1 hypothetical protein [Tsukamurella sp. 8F]